MIDETPFEYNKLYTECWKYESSERPNIQEVVSALKAVIYPNQNDTIVYKINEKKEPEKFKSVSNLSKKTIDIYNDLIDDESLNINEHESGAIAESENSTSTVSNKAGPSIDNTYQSLLKPEKEEFINNVNEKENLEKYKSTLKLSKGTIDISDDLVNDLGSLNIFEYEYKSGIKVEFESSLSSTSNQATKSSTENTWTTNRTGSTVHNKNLVEDFNRLNSEFSVKGKEVETGSDTLNSNKKRVALTQESNRSIE
ncbi:15316_t:CDS:2 [Rhizophagus irregularis]|nr:15316_t:CDS:2 [Rhizophagus irregularis]